MRLPKKLNINKYTSTRSLAALIVILAVGVTGIKYITSSHAATYTSSTVALTTPLHFDDTWWYWPTNPGTSTSLSIYVRPMADGSPNGYFFSTLFIFNNGGAAYNPNGVGFGYMGLQTEEATPSTGKGDIFSIWGATSGSGGSVSQSFTEGQSGWSERNPYPWVVGHIYTLTVEYESTQSGTETWGAFITDGTSGQTTPIGDLIVPASYGMLDNSVATFHELYSGSTSSCSDLTLSSVEFFDPTFNFNDVASSHTNYEPNVTGCSGDYGVAEINGGYQSTIGGLPPSVVTPTSGSTTTNSTSPVTTPVTPTTPTKTTTPASTSTTKTVPKTTVSPSPSTSSTITTKTNSQGSTTTSDTTGSNTNGSDTQINPGGSTLLNTSTGLPKPVVKKKKESSIGSILVGIVIVLAIIIGIIMLIKYFKQPKDTPPTEVENVEELNYPPTQMPNYKTRYPW